MEESFVISHIEYDKDSVKSVILKFQSGKIPPGFEDNLVTRVYRDVRDNSHDVACVVNNILYTGRIRHNKNARNTFMAIPNKKRTKVQLIAADYVMLKPHKEEEDILDTTIPELNTSDLYKEFGGKKVKRALEQRAKLNQSIVDVRENLEKTVADIDFNNESLLDKSDTGDNYRPPINAEAATLEDVYDLENIVSNTVLESLSKSAKQVLNEEDLEGIVICNFIKAELNKVAESSSHTKEKICEMLLYANCLIGYIGVTVKSLTKTYKACPYSEAANKDILEKYSTLTDRRRNRSNLLRDKCICHLLVIGVLASGYKINLPNLAKELKVGIKKLQSFAKLLRFAIVGDHAVLKLPLPSPVSNIPHTKKKK